MTEENYSGDIAVVAMSCRLPSAQNLDALWQNLVQGRNLVEIVAAEELEQLGYKRNKVVFAQSRLNKEEMGMFDAEQFNMSRKEAELTDPQHRLFLDASYEALTQLGYRKGAVDANIGVFASCAQSDYLTTNIYSNVVSSASFDAAQARLNNDPSLLANKISFKLGLTGSSVNVDTQCSSSGVAVHLARESLLSYENDLVIAGGVNLSINTFDSEFYHSNGIGSADGVCRPFDDDATGTVGGSGLGIVILKRLEDAIADNDFIYAVLKGTAINNDGDTKSSFTAPSFVGQQRVISDALAVSEVEPNTIELIEAHGTGTKIGDPIEVQALTKVYREYTQANQYCGIGSIKSNLGHLVRASGVIGLIKAILCLHHKARVPSINYTRPNQALDLADSPFYVDESFQPWESKETPRRAAVSSFGFGGTNFHAILEEAPKKKVTCKKRRQELVFWSAKSHDDLAFAQQRLAESVSSNRFALQDVSFTTTQQQQHFFHRGFSIVAQLSDLTAIAGVAQLNDTFAFSAHTYINHEDLNELKELLGDIFIQTLNKCSEFAKRHDNLEIEQAITHKSSVPESKVMSCAIQVALVDYLLRCGWRPEAVRAQGEGVLAALYAGGYLSLENTMQLSIELAQGKPISESPKFESTGTQVFVANEKGEYTLLDEHKLDIWLNDNTHLHTNPPSEVAVPFVLDNLGELRNNDALLNILNVIGILWQSEQLDSIELSYDSSAQALPLPVPALKNELFWVDFIPVSKSTQSITNSDKSELNPLAISLTLSQGVVGNDLSHIDRNSLEKAVRNAINETFGSAVIAEAKFSDALFGQLDGVLSNNELEGDTSEVICAIWQSVLGCEQSVLTDDFFELGGHSLIAVLMAKRISDYFSVEVTVEDIFSHTQLGLLIEFVEESLSESTAEGAQESGEVMVF